MTTSSDAALPDGRPRVPVPPPTLEGSLPEDVRDEIRLEIARADFGPVIRGEVAPGEGYGISEADHRANVRAAVEAARVDAQTVDQAKARRQVASREWEARWGGQKPQRSRPKEARAQGERTSENLAAEAGNAGGDLPDPASARGPAGVARLHERRSTPNVGDPAERPFLDALARAVAECFLKDLPRAEEAPCE